MKQKIFILTLCFIFIFNTISFGNEKNISNIEYHISKNVIPALVAKAKILLATEPPIAIAVAER